MKIKIGIVLLFSLFLADIPFSSAQKAPKESTPEKGAVLQVMRHVADWQIGQWQTKGFSKPKYNWTYGAAYAGIFELGKLTPDTRYFDFLRGVGNDLKWNTGRRRFFADDYCVAQTFVNMYRVYHEPQMIANFKPLADSIIQMPHTESLSLANRGVMDREWAWCDALFMAPPGLAYLANATGESKYLDIANKLWWKTTDFLYDPQEHLYFRDESYFDKKEKNGAKVFWSRGNGWVMGGLVRMLSNMPTDYPDRPKYIKLYKEMVTRLAALQQADGSWHSSLLDPGSYPSKETSGTGFYTYAILWGLNNGVLDKKTYWPVALKGWNVLVGSVRADGMLGFVQPVGAAPATVDENSTETYGPGAFLLAGSQLYQYLQGWKVDTSLGRHPFIYAGEWDYRNDKQNIWIVKNGKVTWSYGIPIKDVNGELQELGDVHQMSNGNILFSRKVGASEVTMDKKIVWDYIAPKGTEIHTTQPIGLDKVLIMQNGFPAKLIIINKRSGKAEKELIIPTGGSKTPHGQFRHVRYTSAGTFLVAHMDMDKVIEYDANGKAIWSVGAKHPWAAVRLKNGNTLISGDNAGYAREVNKQGETVWEFTQQDAPGILLANIQECNRLANGNTVICNWVPNKIKDPKDWTGSVQLIEVSPDKKVVWAVSSWKSPDLGPASAIQLLDEKGKAEKGELQR